MKEAIRNIYGLVNKRYRENRRAKVLANDSYWVKLLSNPDGYIKTLLEPQSNGDIKKKIFIENVQIINLETSRYCNRRCSYCPVKDSEGRRVQSEMNGDLYSKIIDDLSVVGYKNAISLNLYNEPMADDGIFNKVSKLRSALPKSYIKFNSNGDYIDGRKLRVLSKCGLDAIYITLHTAPTKSYNDHDRIDHFNKFKKMVGVDFKYKVENGVSIYGYFFVGSMKVIVMANNWGEYGNDRAGSLSDLTHNERYTPCSRPFREISIAYDGSAVPCCQFFPENAVNSGVSPGSLESMSVFDIYSSPIMSSFRRDLISFGPKMSPCNSCSDPDPANALSAERRWRLSRS